MFPWEAMRTPTHMIIAEVWSTSFRKTCMNAHAHRARTHTDASTHTVHDSYTCVSHGTVLKVHPLQLLQERKIKYHSSPLVPVSSRTWTKGWTKTCPGTNLRHWRVELAHCLMEADTWQRWTHIPARCLSQSIKTTASSHALAWRPGFMSCEKLEVNDLFLNLTKQFWWDHLQTRVREAFWLCALPGRHRGVTQGR